MATSTIQQKPKSTAEVTVTIPWSEIQQTYKKLFDQAVAGAEVSGFRKGKAPKDLVEKQIDRPRLYQEVVKDIVPKVVAETIKEHNLHPVTTPKVELTRAKENEEWSLTVTLALKPKIVLGDYKTKVQEAKKAKVKIWTPGTEPEKKEKESSVSLDELITTLIGAITVELPDMLVTDETNRLLSDLVDQTKKLGLTVEQYLLAKGKTTDQLRSEYAKQAESNIKLEFILAEIADSEHITVTEEDIDALLSKVENPEEKEKLKRDTYFLAHLIRQQKTINFLSNL